MQIASCMAGYSLGEADLLLRAMARNPSEMESSRGSSRAPRGKLPRQADTSSNCCEVRRLGSKSTRGLCAGFVSHPI